VTTGSTPYNRIPGFYRQETVRKYIPTSPDSKPYDPEHLSTPRVSIVTEHRLIRQAQSPKKPPGAHRPNDWRAGVVLGMISSLRDPDAQTKNDVRSAVGS
jgi:hypothetical protein